MKYRRSHAGHERVEHQVESFDLDDGRGRIVGFGFSIERVTLIEAPDDTRFCRLMEFPELVYFEARTFNTRDGVSYGATHPRIDGLTEEGVRQRIAERRAASRKRAERQFKRRAPARSDVA